MVDERLALIYKSVRANTLGECTLFLSARDNKERPASLIFLANILISAPLRLYVGVTSPCPKSSRISYHKVFCSHICSLREFSRRQRENGRSFRLLQQRAVDGVEVT